MSDQKSAYMSLPEHDKHGNYLIIKAMLEEHRFVDASAFMYCLSLLCRACWLLTFAELISNPPENVSVSSIYTLREATSSNTLSNLNIHYPGVEPKLKREYEKLSDIKDPIVRCRIIVQNVKEKESIHG